MPVSTEKDNLMPKPVSLENSPSCVKESALKSTFEADVIPYDDGPENPVLSVSGNEVNLVFKVPTETFLKMAAAAIKHFKREDKDSSPPEEPPSTSDADSRDVIASKNGADDVSKSDSRDVIASKNGADDVSKSDSVVNNFDSNSTAESVGANKDGDCQENDSKTIEKQACETSLFENQSCTEASDEDVLETTDVPSESKSSQVAECSTSNALHTVSILDEAENKTSDFNNSSFFESPESESPERENTWPEIPPLKKAETIPIKHLKSLAIPGVLTKYFKLKVNDVVVVIKVSGDCKDLNLCAKKYEELETSCDVDFQSEVSGQINSCTTGEKMHLTVRENEDSLKYSVSDVNSLNIRRPKDVCNEKYLQEKNLALAELSESDSSATSNIIETSAKCSESTMNNLHNQTLTKEEIAKTENDSNSELSENLLEHSIDSELKREKMKFVDPSPVVSYFDNSFTLASKRSSPETENYKDLEDKYFRKSGFNSFKMDAKEIGSKVFEESLCEMETESLYEIKTLPISTDVLNNMDDKLLEKALKVSKTVFQKTNKDFKTGSAECENRKENYPLDKIIFKTTLPVCTSTKNVHVDAGNECSEAVHSKEKESSAKSENSSETLAVDKEKAYQRQDVIEESILKESRTSETSELNVDSLKITFSVNVVTEISNDREESNDKNSKFPPDAVESNTGYEITTTEDLSKKEQDCSKTTEESKKAFDGLSKSTSNESSINVKGNGTPVSTIQNSDNISEVDQEKVCQQKDAIEENISKSSSSSEMNELSTDSFRSKTVSVNEVTDINDGDESNDNLNSKFLPYGLKSSKAETELTATEYLSKKELEVEDCPKRDKKAFVSLAKSTFNESNINVEENKSPLNAIKNSDSTFKVTVGEDNITGTSKNVPLNEVNENPSNDVLEYSSPSVKKLENDASELSTIEISESTEQIVSETELVKSSPMSKAHFQSDVVEDANSKFSKLSIDGENDSFSNIEVDTSSASSEKSAFECLENHNSVSPIARDLEIKLPVDDNNEREMFSETEFTKSSKNESFSTADICVKDSDESEKEKFKSQLPDICIHDEKERGLTESPPQMSEEGNDMPAASKSYIYESDESKSASSVSDKVLPLDLEPFPSSDFDAADSAPTRKRTGKAVGSRPGINMSADVIPEDSVTNTKTASRSSALATSVSKSSGRISPTMRTLRSKCVEQTPNTSKTNCEKKSEGVENKKRAATPEIISKKDLKVVARSSPRKIPKKNGSNSEAKVAENRSNVSDTRHKPLFNLDASMSQTTTGRRKRASKE